MKQLLVRIYVGDDEVQIVRMDPGVTRVEIEEIEEEPLRFCSNAGCRRNLHGYRGPLCRYCDGTAE